MRTTAYASYRVLVTSTVGGTSSDGAQYSEINLLGRLQTSLPGSTILSTQDTIAGIKQTMPGAANVLAVGGTDYGSGQSPSQVLDGNVGTKYYNTAVDQTSFPGIYTGFVITPHVGAKAVNGFQIATANDTPTRDPVSITIEGSNAANATQAGGNGFVPLYSGPSGLQSGLARETWALSSTSGIRQPMPPTGSLSPRPQATTVEAPSTRRSD